LIHRFDTKWFGVARRLASPRGWASRRGHLVDAGLVVAILHAEFFPGPPAWAQHTGQLSKAPFAPGNQAAVPASWLVAPRGFCPSSGWLIRKVDITAAGGVEPPHRASRRQCRLYRQIASRQVTDLSHRSHLHTSHLPCPNPCFYNTYSHSHARTCTHTHSLDTANSGHEDYFSWQGRRAARAAAGRPAVCGGGGAPSPVYAPGRRPAHHG
jgi:hypothetical protein